MPTIKEVRKELVELKTFLASQKARLSRSRESADKEWLKYAIENSDKIRERINKAIEMLDALTA